MKKNNFCERDSNVLVGGSVYKGGREVPEGRRHKVVVQYRGQHEGKSAS
jgi:hypothetical protein